MKTPFSLFFCFPVIAMVLSGCAAANASAKVVCDAWPAIAVAGFPAALVLPAGAVLDDQSSGSPPEFASDNYQIAAHSAADIDVIRSFYRCTLPQLGYPIDSEEQGNFWLLRFGGPGIDYGSVLVGDGSAEGEVSIQIFVIEKES